MNTEPEYPDDLEGLLREQLRDFAPDAPERVWTRIKARLPGRRRRPVFWWWVLGAGILTAGLSIGIYRAKHREAPKSESHKSAQASVFPLPTAVPENERPAKASGARYAGSARVAGGVVVLPSAGLSEQAFESDPVAPRLPGGPLLLASAGWPALSPLPGPVVPPVAIGRPDLPGLHFTKKNGGSRRFSAGLFAAPVWIFYKNNSASPHHSGAAPAFSEHVASPSTGWQTGVSLAYALDPRWRLETGVWRREETLHTTHLATLRLMDGVCLNPYAPGAKHYEFQYALRSAGTTADVTVRISQVDSLVTMSLDEPFSLDMRTTRQTRSWTFPLSLSRNFGKGRWQGFVRGGLALDYTAETSVQVEHFSEMCVDLCFSTGLLPSVTLLPQQRFSAQYLLGAGLEYRLLPRFGIRLEPTFFGKKGRAALAANAGVFYHF